MFRIYIERKNGFENEAQRYENEFSNFLGIQGISRIRYINRYDIENISDDIADKACRRIFSEPQSDILYKNHLPLSDNDAVIAWEYLPGQYDQRSDSAQQCLSLLMSELTVKDPRALVRCAKILIISGTVSAADIEKIQKYVINPVDSQKASPDIPQSLVMRTEEPSPIAVQTGFISFSDEELESYRQKMGLAMDSADVKFMRDYFKKEGRDPFETEVKVLDTYWSDHCRHTTFNTVLEKIEIEDGYFSELFKKSLENYEAMRTELYADRTDKPVTLMDMAVIGAKYLKKHGKLEDIELSEEINACSIYIDVHTEDAGTGAEAVEKWLLMFKNETHNHPTEIEPFGGAATCIGGAIRDPLSGRSWVYQALRVTGASDPTVPVSQTREGKLPQMKLTREAAAGFSSYGNQIGLTTGQVAEIYHPGFEAKRMELGAVIAAAPAHTVMREIPESGDCIVLVGGGTGRDGIGGATGSSKVHTTESVSTAAAEVQKGNAVEERKIQRLFRNPKVSTMIRRCNDFGAGGVAVAVGELAPGLEIDLDAVPKKYDGLNGTELAISESQERMAIVVREKDVQTLISEASKENLNATMIAKVTDTNRLVMKWKGSTIVDIDRAFLDTAGAQRSAAAKITSPNRIFSPLCRPLDSVQLVLNEEARGVCKPEVIKKAWLENLKDLACCSQRGLSERFDGSIGSSSVLFPMGGTEQSTPEAGCAAKIPVLSPKETTTASIMTFGYDPRVSQWSPWHGAQTAVLQSLAKLTTLGGNPENARLTFQEYFERAVSKEAWGKPAAAMLGALSAQKSMGTAAIGGKDSMSGSFQELTVPPTLVSFAVTTEDAKNIVSGSFKKAGSYIYAAIQPYSELLEPDFEAFKDNAKQIRELRNKGLIRAMYPVGAGGLAEALSKMAFGNNIGCTVESTVQELLFVPMYGTIVIETAEKLDTSKYKWLFVGKTQENQSIDISLACYSAAQNNQKITASIPLTEARSAWEQPLSSVFLPVSGVNEVKAVLPKGKRMPYFARGIHSSLKKERKAYENNKNGFYTLGKAKPLVLLPVFPGTNCEYDMARAFNLAGAQTKIIVFRNHTEKALEESLVELKTALGQSQILALSGGFSAGDEPDGSGKFIANVLREHRIKDAVMNLIKNKDGLILGICNGFQALIKVGLLPYGLIMDTDDSMPTLTYNTIGRHISRVCRTRVCSALSPWAKHESVIEDSIHLIPVSHGEGRIIVSDETAKVLFKNGQVFSQYVDEQGKPAIKEPHNPNGSMYAIEGITSFDGRILGKMGHNERTIGTIPGGHSEDIIKNISGNKCQNIFAAGVSYFK